LYPADPAKSRVRRSHRTDVGLRNRSKYCVFSILDALAIRNLPVWRPDRLVQVAALYRNGATVPVSFPAFQQLQQHQRVFLDLFGWTPGIKRNVEVDGELFPTSVRGVTGNYYETLGAAPRVGRLVASEDAAVAPGRPVAVLGYEFLGIGFDEKAGRRERPKNFEPENCQE
jgi:hypothetical protein